MDADLLLIGSSLVAGVACFFAARRARSRADPGTRPPMQDFWGGLAGAAIWYSFVQLVRKPNFIMWIGIDNSPSEWLLPQQFRTAMLSLAVLFLVAAVGTHPVLSSLWTSRPRLDNLEVAASFLTICLVPFLLRDSSTRDILLTTPIWGWLWLASFAGGLALGVAGVLLLVAVWPRVVASDLMLALAMFAWSLAAMRIGWGDDGWVAGWIAGWLLLLVASLRRKSPVLTQNATARMAAVRRAAPAILVIGALASAMYLWLVLESVKPLWAGIVVVLLALGRRLATPGADGRPGWRDWRTRLRSPAILLISLGLATLWLVSQTLLVGPRPNPDEAAIAFAVRGFEPEALRGFRIDVNIGVPTSTFKLGCRNPVYVTAVISGTPEMWKDVIRRDLRDHGGPLGSTADFGIAVVSPVALSEMTAALASDPTVPINPSFQDPNGSSPFARTVKATFRPAERYVSDDVLMIHAGRVSGSIKDWKSSWIPLVVSFQADWVQRRSFGSCYVLLPSLTGNSKLSSLEALIAAVQAAHGGKDDDGERVAASYGRIRLDVEANVLAEVSVPQPVSFGSTEAAATWTCASSPLDMPAGRGSLPQSPSGNGVALPSNQRLPEDSSCGGFAVVSTENSQVLRELSLIAIGVLISIIISIIIEIAYSEARR